MSHFTEKSRKLAGISEMTPGSYPKDSHQRGCQFWAKFVTACDTLHEEKREECDRLREEVKAGSQENLRLIRENSKLKSEVAAKGIKLASRAIRDEIPDFTPGHESRLLDAAK